MPRSSALPASILAAAILLFTYGGLLLLCGICGSAGLAMPDPAGEGAKLKALLDKDAPGHRIVQFGTLAMHLLLGATMLAAGLGVMKLMPIARIVACLAIVVELTVTCGQNLFQAIFVMPVTEKFLAQALQQQGGAAPPFDMGALLKGASWFGVVVVVLVKLGLLLPIAICLWMPTARAAFAGKPDVDDDRPPRRRKETDGDDDNDEENDDPPRHRSGDTGITDRPRR